MNLPSHLIVHDSAYALDGGSRALLVTDEAGHEHFVMLMQHVIITSRREGERVPGRLYFNDELIPIRSSLEANVLALLRSSELRVPDRPEEPEPHSGKMVVIGQDIQDFLDRTPEQCIRETLTAIIGFVESDEYLRVAEQVARLD